jgi:hypothetical protein
LVHKGRIVGRSSTFENLPKRKQAGLKVRSGVRAIQCVVLRSKGYMGMKLRNQVVQIALRLNCRWIGQPVERCPNNQQAQQTCRDLDSHSLVACPFIPWGMCAACSHSRSQILSEVMLRSIGLGSKGIPSLSLMRETLSEMAGAENGKAVKRNGNQLRTLGATVEISCHSACPYQKLHWPTISEVSRAPCRCVSDQTLSGVGPSTKK